ncbi:hypothetical protein GCM10009742_73280 [Kribbella karoonensis]|uniref:Uncharacterized protein n=1 Tax=Kribbella karoonensis TaxID=324851 RepID=A0ABP4QKJ7_9ACTN
MGDPVVYLGRQAGPLATGCSGRRLPHAITEPGASAPARQPPPARPAKPATGSHAAGVTFQIHHRIPRRRVSATHPGNRTAAPKVGTLARLEEWVSGPGF